MLDPQLSAQLSELGFDPAAVETMLRWATYVTVASVVAAVPTGMIAKRKGRSATRWVVFELCIPIIPLILVWLLPARKKPPEP